MADLASPLGGIAGGEAETVGAAWYLGTEDAGFAGTAVDAKLVGVGGLAGAIVAASGGANAGFATGTGAVTEVVSRKDVVDNAGADAGAVALAAGDAV